MKNTEVKKFGALTSKPYAFNARTWELRHIPSYDFFDCFGSPIRIDVRGNQIMRIVPRESVVNEGWISDKIRFSYDSVKIQRLESVWIPTGSNEPPVRSPHHEPRTLKKRTWPDFFKRLNDYRRAFPIQAFEFRIGPFVDLETTLVVKQFLSVDKRNKLADSACGLDNVDKALSLYMRETADKNWLEKFLNSSMYFLIGLDPRVEFPVLAARLRTQVIHKKKKVYVFGPGVCLLHEYVHAGTSLSNLLTLAEGRHPICRELLTLNNSTMVLTTVKVVKHFSCLNLLYFLRDMVNIFSNLNLVIFPNSISESGSLSIGLSSSPSFTKKYKNNFLYSLDTEKPFKPGLGLSKGYDLSIYQGHHIEESSVPFSYNTWDNRLFLLPGCTPFEKNTNYFTFEAKVVKLGFVSAPPGNSRNDWKILESLLLKTYYNGDEGLKKFQSNSDTTTTISPSFPFFDNGGVSILNSYDRFSIFPYSERVSDDFFLTNSSYSNFIQNKPNLTRKDLIPNSNFFSLVKDFYLTDTISKFSKFMGLASARFRKKIFN